MSVQRETAVVCTRFVPLNSPKLTHTSKLNYVSFFMLLSVSSVKIARLYLLSDVLHNSSAPVKKASSYRTHLQKGLPEVKRLEGVYG